MKRDPKRFARLEESMRGGEGTNKEKNLMQAKDRGKGGSRRASREKVQSHPHSGYHKGGAQEGGTGISLRVLLAEGWSIVAQDPRRPEDPSEKREIRERYGKKNEGGLKR